MEPFLTNHTGAADYILHSEVSECVATSLAEAEKKDRRVFKKLISGKIKITEKRGH